MESRHGIVMYRPYTRRDWASSLMARINADFFRSHHVKWIWWNRVHIVAWWTRGMESSCATVQTLHTKRLSCMAMFCEKKNQHKQNKQQTRIWFSWRWSRASTASATMNKSSWLPNVFAIDWRGCEIQIIYHGQQEPCSAQRYAFTFCEYIVVQTFCRRGFA